MVIDLDSGDNADWNKRWDVTYIPPYKTPAFFSYLQGGFAGISLEQFRTLPLYKNAVRDGLIVDDEWTGPIDPMFMREQ